jgi:hypothetical protein
VQGPAALRSLEAHVVLLVALVLMASVWLPLHFRLGAGRGLISFVAIAVVAVITVSLATRLLLSAKGYPGPMTDPQAWRALIAGWMRWAQPRLALLLTLMVGAAAAAMGISQILSTRAYEKRDL